MSFLFHLTPSSNNSKTGPIPVSTSSAALCPASCPFRGGDGCYAESGPLALHWKEVTTGRRDVTWSDFLALIRALPVGQLWRHNQAGDLLDPDTDNGALALDALTRANRGRRGFTFSHHPLTRRVVRAFRAATFRGFTVNASTETIAAADAAVAAGLFAVTVVSSTDERRAWTSPAGNPVRVCPAQLHDAITCQRCQLCHDRPASVIIAFRSHGVNRRRVDAWLPQEA